MKKRRICFTIALILAMIFLASCKRGSTIVMSGEEKGFVFEEVTKTDAIQTSEE